MFSRLTNCIFSILILFIFTKTTSVYGATCSYDQITCYGYPPSPWCCPINNQCGSYSGACYPLITTTPSSSSDIPPAIIGVIIVVSVSFCIICLVCCIRSNAQQQSLRTSYVRPNVQTVTTPYQQQTAQGTRGAAYIRPVYNIGSARPYQQSPYMYEAPPPSYEAATAHLPTIHQSSLPINIPVDETNLRV